MQNAKGENLCELCFSPCEAAVCPNCSKAKRPVYFGSIPNGTLLGGRYVSGLLVSRSNVSTEYLCFDTKTDMRVVISEYFPVRWAQRDNGSIAVKFHTDSSSGFCADGLNAFRAESEAMLNMSRSKYLAEVIGSFKENNTAYRVMRYYGLRTLDRYMQQTGEKLSPELAVTAACQVAFGLQSAHEAGLVHGDICPSNIIICNDGTIKLTGVSGICRSYYARAGSIEGIVRTGYAAAELYKKSAASTVEADYYALGALLYYMLTGKELTDSITRLERGGITPPIDNLSSSVLLVIGRLLSLLPKDRESGFNELLDLSARYGVTSIAAPSARATASAETSRHSDISISGKINTDNFDASSFTERIPNLDEEEEEVKTKPSLKKGLIITAIVLLAFAAAAAGIVAAYYKINGGFGKKDPVNNDPVLITVNESESLTIAERTTSVTQTQRSTTEPSSTETSTGEITTAERATTERTTVERTTAERTTAERTTERETSETETTVSYAVTDDYTTGKYSVVSSVRIRTSPENDSSNANVIKLVESGAQVVVSSVYDTGEQNGDYRYWGYIRYQGSEYYYDGYVPMSSLKIVTQ